MDNPALAKVDLVRGAKAARKFIALQERAVESQALADAEGGELRENDEAPVDEEKKPEGAFATLVNGITNPIEKLGTSSLASREP